MAATVQMVEKSVGVQCNFDGYPRTRGEHFAFSRMHLKFSISPSSQDRWKRY